MLALGVAAASLSSCSSSQYAFNGRTPSYLGSQRVATPVVQTTEESPSEVLTASAGSDLTPIVVSNSPARQAATALAHRAAVAATPRTAATVTVAQENTVSAPITHKAVKQATKRQLAAAPQAEAEGKSQVVALILSFFLGNLGIDRFYLGYTGIGILKLLTFGVFGILGLIDFIRILIGSLKPKGGEYTKKL